MSAAALLAEVEAIGARLRVEGGKLVATGTRLPAPLVERLLADKAAILATLAAPANASERKAAVDPSRCRYCGSRMPDLRVVPPSTPSPRAWRDAASAAPGAVVFGDGSVGHARCYEADRFRRTRRLGHAPELEVGRPDAHREPVPRAGDWQGAL